MRTHEVGLSFRIPVSLSEKIEVVRSMMASRNIGIEVERTQVVRLLLTRGLEVVERELRAKK
jgi:hypothetical protein